MSLRDGGGGIASFSIHGGTVQLQERIDGLLTRLQDLLEERDVARAERNALLRHLRAAHDDSWRPGNVEITYERAHLHLTERMDPL